jgi:hypothetical protein
MICVQMAYASAIVPGCDGARAQGSPEGLYHIPENLTYGAIFLACPIASGTAGSTRRDERDKYRSTIDAVLKWRRAPEGHAETAVP